MRGKFFIHVCTDDKFINSAYQTFEKAFPQSNEFYVLAGHDNLKYISERVPIQRYYKEKVLKIINAKTEAEVIFHGFNKEMKYILEGLHLKSRATWMIFGAEIYNKLYLHSSNREIFNLRLKLNNKKFLTELIKYLRRYLLLTHDRNEYSVFKTFNKIGIIHNEEIMFFQKLRVVNDSVKVLNFTYFPIDNSSMNEEYSSGSDVLLGNSGWPSNLYSTVIDKVKSSPRNLSSKIIIPLAYGNQTYIKDLKEFLKQNFERDSIKVLENFMPYEKYLSFLNQIGFAVFPSKRQQAVGTTVVLLRKGVKIYLSEKNTFFSFLRNIGVKIYSVERDTMDFRKGLSSKEKRMNKIMIEKYFSEERILKNLRNFYQ